MNGRGLRLSGKDRRRVQGAIRTEYNGRVYPSKHEANEARNLDLKKKAGLIKDWDYQFKIEMTAYDQNGMPAMTKTHRIDFRIHELDGMFTLHEAKGYSTEDYIERREWLKAFWLPFNPEYRYEVHYNKSSWRDYKGSATKNNSRR